uniref:Conotoxin n=1 Tax=Gongylonema pulchrum TaxID=637853 RepID=A0A183EXG7_9BILA
LNKPAARYDAPKTMRPLKLETTDAALKAIEKFRRQEEANERCELSIGVSCKNPGCDKVCCDCA